MSDDRAGRRDGRLSDYATRQASDVDQGGGERPVFEEVFPFSDYRKISARRCRRRVRRCGKTDMIR